MVIEGVLPIGSVVLLGDSVKRLMIMGYCQQDQETKEMWDYVGCLYPEGFLGAAENYLFNQEQIERLYALGYQDEEQINFKIKLDESLAALAQAAEA